MAEQAICHGPGVDNLSPHLSQAMLEGWLNHIKAAYAAEPGDEASGPSNGQGKVVVE